MFWNLVFLSISQFIEVETEHPNIKNEFSVVLGYYNDTDVIEEKKNFEFASEYFPNINFYSINCSKYHGLCNEFNILYKTGVSFVNNGKATKFYGDHAAYEYINLLIKDYHQKPSKEMTEIKYIKKSNFSEFAQNKRCALVGFLMNNERQSTIMHTTLKQLTNIYQRDLQVNISAFDCLNDVDDCIELGIEAAPIFRIYHGSEYSDFKGIRTFDNLRKFINSECGCDRSSDGSLNDHAGIIDAALPYVELFMKSTDKYSAMKKIKEIPNTEAYQYFMKKILKNEFEFVETEKKKTLSILNKTKKDLIYYDTLIKNVNVLNQFLERAPYVKPEQNEL